MCQACRRFIEDGVNEEVLDKPEAVRVLKGVLEMINTGLISASHAETLIGKGFRQNRYTIYDAWVFAQLHVRYFTGFLLTQFVPFTKRGVRLSPTRKSPRTMKHSPGCQNHSEQSSAAETCLEMGTSIGLNQFLSANFPRTHGRERSAKRS